jgi:hypothetical protein
VREEGTNKITEVSRRDIVDAVLLDSVPFYGRLDLIGFLRRVWPLQTMPSTDDRFKDAEGDIWQHMVNNSDWTMDELLYRRLHVLDMPDEMFAKFLEACVHPLASPEPDRTNGLVAMFNEALSKDGFVMRASGEISGRKLYKAESATGAGGLKEAYEVVLSFAGEDRDYVNEVAETLKDNDVSLFYDGYEEATLWGKDLVEHLHKVYSGSARYCVMFISRFYAEKVWPTHERRSAFERAVEAKEEYILPARFDDTALPGLRKTIHYIDLRKKTARELAALILEKLGRKSLLISVRQTKESRKEI